MSETLKHVDERVIISVWMENKNIHTFADGTKIRLERKYDNFDRKYTQPVNAIVIDGKDMPAGSEILIHHNSADDNNRIFNYHQVSGSDIASDIKYFSVPVSECFAWRHGKDWHPLPGFDFALRIFKPYKGFIQGIEPELIKNVLYITTGEYAGKVGIMIKASDYQIIYQDVNGQEGNLIRIRTHGDEKTKREPEVVAIHDDYTEQVLNGSLIVGIDKSDAKLINEIQYAG